MSQEVDPENSQKISDRELVEKSIKGDLEAFEDLVSRYQQAVFNIAYYKSKNCFDAEDLSQDVFLAAFKALPTLKNTDNFGGWLFGIANNRCHKWYHRERNKVVKIQEIRRRVEQEQRMGWLKSHPDTPPLGEDDSSLSQLLKDLPEETRKIITLKYLEGLSYQEIEARLGIKPHRIDYLIRKGKKMLRARWEATSRERQG